MALFEPDSDLLTGPLVTGAPDEPVLAVDDIQGVVLPGFGTLGQHLLGVRFADAPAARRWLARWGPEVSSLRVVNEARNRRRAALRRGKPRPRTPTWLGIGLSADALRLLGLAPESLGDPGYSVGLHARAGLLGDPPAGHDGHPSTWQVGGTSDTTPHVLLIVGADEGAALDEMVQRLEADPDGTVGYTQRGQQLEDEKEHFGFKDGVSQVGIRGRLSDDRQHFLTRRWIDPDDPAAMTLARPGQPLVWPGQFLFGLPRQRRDTPLEPGPPLPSPAWAANGSLLAFRRLRQDVAAFRAFTRAEAERLRRVPGFAEVTQPRLEALLVGRWPDGSALQRSPAEPDPDAVRDMMAINFFGFAQRTADVRVCADPGAAREALAAAADELRLVDGVVADPEGRRCPAFAHIRKVNPRDLVTDQGGGSEHTLALQMLRRGITWGSPYVEESDPAASDRGLLFMSWQTSLEDQFEVLTARWMNRTSGPEGASGHDMLVGQAPTRECVVVGSGGDRDTLQTDVRWVLPTGGGYFFGPSLSTLAELAAGASG